MDRPTLARGARLLTVQLMRLEGIPAGDYLQRVRNLCIYGPRDPFYVQKHQARLRDPSFGAMATVEGIASGMSLLDGLTVYSTADLDECLKAGRVETQASMCIEILEKGISLGTCTEIEPLAVRVLENLTPWGENCVPVWAQPTANTGLLSRVLEAHPDLQIHRDSDTGNWSLYSGTEKDPVATSMDFGHLLAETLTNICPKDRYPR